MTNASFKILFFICCSAIAFTQTVNDVDSFKRELAATKEDTTKVLLMGKLSRAYLFSYPDSSFVYAEQGLQLSRRINFIKGEALCLRWMAGVCERRGYYSKAIELGLQALAAAESIPENEEIARIYSLLSHIYTTIGDYRKSLDYAYQMKHYANKFHDDKVLLVSLSNIGDGYEKVNSLDSALLYQQEAYLLALRLHDEQAIGIAFINLGNIHSKMGNADLALPFYRKSIPFVATQNDFESLKEIYLGMARIFMDTRAKDSTEFYARLAFYLSDERNNNSGKLDASKFLADFYNGESKTDSAYKYLAIAVALKDSLFNEEKVRQVEYLTFKEHLRQLELAEAKAKEQQERKNNLQLLGIAIFIITFSLFVVLLSRKKLKPRTIEFTGLLALLLLFEFISLILHPIIGEWTHHTPVLMLVILVVVAALLVPAHHRLQRWVKEKLVHKASPTTLQNFTD